MANLPISFYIAVFLGAVVIIYSVDEFVFKGFYRKKLSGSWTKKEKEETKAEIADTNIPVKIKCGENWMEYDKIIRKGKSSRGNYLLRGVKDSVEGNVEFEEDIDKLYPMSIKEMMTNPVLQLWEYDSNGRNANYKAENIKLRLRNTELESRYEELVGNLRKLGIQEAEFKRIIRQAQYTGREVAFGTGNLQQFQNTPPQGDD